MQKSSLLVLVLVLLLVMLPAAAAAVWQRARVGMLEGGVISSNSSSRKGVEHWL
jgi:hypothetical protein